MRRSKTQFPLRAGEARLVHIQSLDRGLQLLEKLALAPEAVGSAELSRVLGVDRSTVHRLLGTLQRRGYVQQDQATRHYRLGLKVVELSRQVLDGLAWPAVARGHLEALARDTGESASLVVVAGGQVMCVMHRPSAAALTVNDVVGVALVPHATACGKVLLAHATDGARATLLADEPLAAQTPRTLTDRAALTLHLKQIQQQGYALEDEERHTGVRSIAAPVWNHGAEVMAALSLSGPALRLTYDRLPVLITCVHQAAERLSAALGYVQP